MSKHNTSLSCSDTDWSEQIADIKEGDVYKARCFIKQMQVLNDKHGKPYIRMVLKDKTGEIEARTWERISHYSTDINANSLVEVIATCKVFRNKKHLLLKSCQLIRYDESMVADFFVTNPLDEGKLYNDLVQLMVSLQDLDYRALALALLCDDVGIQKSIQTAPAGKNQHHAYKSGFLEHTLSVCRILDQIASIYGSILNRSLLLLGGLVHDIGKIYELDYTKPITEYTVEGNLLGHVIIGVQMMDQKVQQLRQKNILFPEEKKRLLQHIIISHHGQFDYGAPREPAFLEAYIVHMVDNLDANVNTIKTYIQEDKNNSLFTAFHPKFNRSFYKKN